MFAAAAGLLMSSVFRHQFSVKIFTFYLLVIKSIHVYLACHLLPSCACQLFNKRICMHSHSTPTVYSCDSDAGWTRRRSNSFTSSGCYSVSTDCLASQRCQLGLSAVASLQAQLITREEPKCYHNYHPSHVTTSGVSLLGPL